MISKDSSFPLGKSCLTKSTSIPAAATYPGRRDSGQALGKSVTGSCEMIETPAIMQANLMNLRVAKAPILEDKQSTIIFFES
jgi:hypothetical protein